MNKFRIARAGIDVNQGIQRVCGDVDLFEALLLQFLEDHHYEELTKALEEENVTAAFQAAHALKGIAGNMSMTALYDAICPVVETLRAESLDVQEGMGKVTEAFEKVHGAIIDMKESKK